MPRRTNICTVLLQNLKQIINIILYIRNLKYAHLTPIFRRHNIHLVSSTCQHKYRWILCTEKPVLNATFQDFWFTNIKNHLICFEKTVNMYLKAKNNTNTLNTYLSSISKTSDAKIYISIFVLKQTEDSVQLYTGVQLCTTKWTI